MDKMSSLTNFPWHEAVRIIPFYTKLLLTLNRAWISSSLILSIQENGTCLWKSLMPLHHQSLLCFSTQLVLFLILLNCSLPLALGLINCARVDYISIHPAAFGFWSSTPPDDITLTPNIRKADWSLAEFQTWHWCRCSCHSQHCAAHFSLQSCPC